MNDNVLIFTPKFELDAKRNLKDFILFSESLPPLNQEMDYASVYWKGSANFTKMGVSSKSRAAEGVLDESIIPFAKAYVLYSQNLNPAKTLNELKAIRAIEKVMVRASGKVDVCTVNSTIFDQAAQEVSEHYKEQAAYQGGTHLEKLQKFLVQKKIAKNFTWKNRIKRSEDTVERVGREGAENRAKKLPDENGLLALAEIFALGEGHLSPRDIFTTSCMALLLAAPARASELFYLKDDCLHEDTDRHGNKALGIKWYSGKGYGYEVEWVPGAMEATVREAIKRLRNLSKGARKFAKELELKNGEEVYTGNMSGFPNIKYRRGDNVVVKFSQGLFTLYQSQLHTIKTTNEQKLWVPNINTLNEDLAPTKKKKRGTQELSNVKSLFERYEYPSYIVTSHQIRHLLTTIAKVNGMETELLTKWAGRANEKHNRVYNHTTSEQYNQQMAVVSRNNLVKTELYPAIEVVKPESIQEINTSASLTLHQTEYGVCIHDYIMSPCSKHRNCITCTEQVCIKGDEEKLVRLRKRLALEELALVSDKAAMDEETIGADRHYNKRLETIHFCSELIEKLTDDNLPDGSLIKLSSCQEMSHLDKAMDINGKKRLPKIEKNRKPKMQVLNEPSQALAKFKLSRGF